MEKTTEIHLRPTRVEKAQSFGRRVLNEAKNILDIAHYGKRPGPGDKNRPLGKAF
jgi:hypothetical protein